MRFAMTSLIVQKLKQRFSPKPMRKFDIALMLAQRYGYTSYLEICTPLTGRTFSQIDRQQFSRRVRLMYLKP
jgi:hypothetical protein